MRQVYSWVSAVLAVALAAAACGGGENEPPVERETTAGFTTYDVPSAGFSIAVPETWKTATPDEVFGDEDLERIEEDDPQLAQFIRMVVQGDSPLKFIAFDPNVTDEFATNLNVIVEDLHDFTREEYFDANINQLEELGDLQGIEEERVELPAGDALHLVYPQEVAGSPPTYKTIQYILFEDGTGYVLTYSVSPDRVDEYAETFERSARSFGLD